MRGQAEQTVRVWPTILLVLFGFVALVSCPEAEGQDFDHAINYGEPRVWLDASEWIGSPAVPLTIRYQPVYPWYQPRIREVVVVRDATVTPRVTEPSLRMRRVCLEFDIEDNEFVCVRWEVKVVR